MDFTDLMYMYNLQRIVHFRKWTSKEPPPPDTFPSVGLTALFCWLAWANSSGFGSLKLGTSEYTMQNLG